MSNNRRSPRLPMKLDVELVHDKIGQHYLVTKDISETGVFIKIPPEQQPDVGTFAKVKLKDNFADGEEPQTLKMRVVRHSQDGIGLEFVDD
ncbi:MAG: PilZ domain-containing protein [Gammaproteobacteria bacterium]|jgi:hypothetical protein